MSLIPKCPVLIISCLLFSGECKSISISFISFTVACTYLIFQNSYVCLLSNVSRCRPFLVSLTSVITLYTTCIYLLKPEVGVLQ